MKDTCSVTNKSAGRVVYKIPELNLRREFYPHETKKNIAVDELEKLAQMPGGRNILYNYLMVNDPEVICFLINGEVPPEYWFSEEKLPGWMNSCSLDEFKDALDFSPQGTKDLIKKYAFEMPLNDFAKRQAIKEQLGFDVTRALENSKDDESESENNKPTTRRIQTNTTTPQRRVQITANN